MANVEAVNSLGFLFKTMSNRLTIQHRQCAAKAWQIQPETDQVQSWCWLGRIWWGNRWGTGEGRRTVGHEQGILLSFVRIAMGIIQNIGYLNWTCQQNSLSGWGSQLHEFQEECSQTCERWSGCWWFRGLWWTQQGRRSSWPTAGTYRSQTILIHFEMYALTHLTYYIIVPKQM